MKYVTPIALVGGLGVGAGLFRAIGPGSFQRRKNVLRDKARHAVHELEEAADVTALDVKNRTKGLLWETFPFRARRTTDEVLVARVRSKLGRVCANPGAIEVQCTGRTCRLAGVILEEELTQVLSAVENVRGIGEVTNDLEAYARPGDHPLLQHPASHGGDRFELLQRNWSPAARAVAGATGGAVMLYGIKQALDVQRSIARRRRMKLVERTALIRGVATAIPTGLLGLGLLARSISNTQLKEVVGAAPGALHLQKTLHVNAPIDECFTFWTNMETFPRFMQHVKQVKRIGENRWHWRVEGPLGTSFHWDSEVTRIEQNKLISWRSIEGAMVQTEGSVHFEPGDFGETRIHVDLRYTPPGGALGHAFAKVFGVDPKQQMDDDLLRLKSLLEVGKTTVKHREVRLSDISRDFNR